MNTKNTLSKVPSVILAALLMVLVPSALAQTQRWLDVNGQGSGGSGVTGGSTYTWSTGNSIWGNTLEGQSGTNFVWTNGDFRPYFSAGIDGGVSFTMDVPTAITTAGVTVEEGSSLAFTGTTITLHNGGAGNDININSGISLVINNQIAGSNTGLEKLGAGTLILAGANTYTGTNTVAAGILQVGNSGTTGTLSGSLTTLSSGATLQFIRTDSVTVSQTVSGSGSITQNGPGTVELTGNNTSYVGTTFINSGTLRFGTNALGTSGDINFQSGKLVYAAGNTQDISSRIKNSPLPVHVDIGANNVTWASGLASTNAGGFVKDGVGILTLTGSSSYTNGTTVLGGTLQVGNGGATGALGAGTISLLAGSTLSYNRSDAVSLAQNITNHGLLTQTGSGALTLTGIISGSGGVTQAGTGTLTLTNGNTYTGATIINAGRTLVVGNGGASGYLDPLTAITNNGTLINNRTGTISLSNSITGLGVFIKQNTSTLTLSGSNSFTGGINLDGGVLVSGSPNAFGTTGTVDFGGGQLQYTSFNPDISARIGNSSAAINVDVGTAVTWAGNIASSNTAGLTKSGAATLTLSGSNAYTGGTRINSGTIAFANNGLGTTGTVEFDGGSLVYAAGNTQDISSRVANSSSLIAVDTGTNAVTWAGNLDSTNTLGLAKAGTGTLILIGSNTYLGGNSVSQGTLQIGNGGTQGILSGTTTALASGAILRFNRSDAVSVTQTITGAGGLNQAGTGTLTLIGSIGYTGPTSIDAGSTLRVGDGITHTQIQSASVTNNGSLVFDSPTSWGFFGGMSGTGALIKQGSNTLTLQGTNTYSGGTTITSGSLTVAGSVSSLGTGAVSVGTGALLNLTRTTSYSFSNTLSGDGNLSRSGAGTMTFDSNASAFSGTMTLNGTVIVGSGTSGGLGSGPVAFNSGSVNFNRTDSYSIANNIAGSSSITKSQSGTLTLTGSNSYAGNTTISAGVLQLGNGGTTGSIVGTGTITGSAGGFLAINRSDTVTLTNSFTGGVGLIQSGAGTTTISGSVMTSNGAIFINSGTLRLTSSWNGAAAITNNASFVVDKAGTLLDNTIGGSGNLIKEGAGLLILRGANFYTGKTIINSGTLQVGAGTFGQLGGTDEVINNAALVFNRSDAMTVNNAISGGGSVTKIGSGTTSLTAENTYTGTTTISAGTLALSGSAAIADTGAVILANASGAILLLESSETIGSLAGGGASGGNVVLGANTLTFGNASNTTFAGAISGVGGSLVKQGAGTVTLTGSNSYTGSTTISEGALIFNGSTPGNLEVAAGATLQGSGSFTGNTSISGSHKPGNSPGLQSFENLTYNNGSSVEWELISNSLTVRGTDFDGINVSGDLTINPTSTVNLVFNVGSTVDWNDDFWDTDRSWLFYDVDDTRFGTFSLGSVSADADGDTLASVRAEASFTLTYAGQDVLISYTVPEPGIWTLVVLGLAFVLYGYRRRPGMIRA